MRKIGGVVLRRIGFVLLVVALLCIPASVSAADPFLASQSLYYVDFSAPGLATIQEYLHNVSGKPCRITVEPWYSNDGWYANPTSSDTKWMAVSWITDITPSDITLPVNNKALINITITVPEGTPDGKYIGWLKVSGGGLDKPVTIVVRVGSAVPQYEFGISQGSYYRLTVTGNPAYVEVNDVSEDNPDIKPIVVKSTSSTLTYYQVRVALIGDRTISIDSEVKHTPEEVGLTFKEIALKESSAWMKIWAYNGDTQVDCTVDHPLELEPFGLKQIYWRLDIPDNLPNGYYAIHLRIFPAVALEGTASNIKCDYAVPLLIHVDRSFTSSKWWWPVVGAGVLACAGIGVMIVLERRKKYNA